MKRSLCSSIEPLEARIAPAGIVTASLAGGKLTLTGDADANVISITVPSPGTITIAGNGGTIAFNGAAPAASVTTSLPFAEIAAAFGAGNDTFTVTGISLGKGLKFDGAAGNDTLNVNNSLINGALTFLGGAENDNLNTGGAHFHAGKVLADLGTGDNNVGPAATLSTVAGDFTVKGGAGTGSNSLLVTGTQFLVGGGLSFAGGQGNENISLVSTSYFAVDRSLVLTLGAFNTDSSNVINAPTFSVGGDLVINSQGTFKNSVNFTNNSDLIIGGKTTIKGGSNDEGISFSNGRASFLGGVAATLGAGANSLVFTGSAATFLGSMKYSGGAGADTLTFSPGPEVTIAGALDVKLGDGGNTVSLDTIPDLTIGGGVKVSAGVGTDTVTIKGTTVEVKKGMGFALGGGTDTVTVSGPTMHVSGLMSFAGGSDVADSGTLNLNSGDALLGGGVSMKSTNGVLKANFNVTSILTVVGDFRFAGSGSGAKTVILTAPQAHLSGALDLKGGADGNDFTVTSTTSYQFGRVKVQGGAVNDTVKLLGDGQVAGLVDVQLGKGGNQLIITGNTAAGTVLHQGLKLISTSEDGDTEIVTLTNVILPGAFTAKLGAGFATVTLNDITAAGAVTIDTGAGPDTVSFENANTGTRSIYSGVVKILLGTGGDTVNLGITAMANALVELQAPMFIDGGVDADADFQHPNNVVFTGTGVITPSNFP